MCENEISEWRLTFWSIIWIVSPLITLILVASSRNAYIKKNQCVLSYGGVKEAIELLLAMLHLNRLECLFFLHCSHFSLSWRWLPWTLLHTPLLAVNQNTVLLQLCWLNGTSEVALAVLHYTSLPMSSETFFWSTKSDLVPTNIISTLSARFCQKSFIAPNE